MFQYLWNDCHNLRGDYTNDNDLNDDLCEWNKQEWVSEAPIKEHNSVMLWMAVATAILDVSDSIVSETNLKTGTV